MFSMIQVAGLKNFKAPKDYSDVIIPEKPKLSVMPRVPTLPPQTKPFKMQKSLRFMMGPEEIHNKLIHKQYGIIALMGGRLRHGHFEMMRNTLNRKIDPKRMFLVYRVDAPWQPLTKKEGSIICQPCYVIINSCNPVPFTTIHLAGSRGKS
ncbi:mitochondrial ribosomal large subunit component [Homalodisca vitripennis]|nr:mitochondrial ribosomal large subunit component [Homalodisca vitripennis]